MMVRPLLFVAVAVAASWAALAGCNVSAVSTDSTTPSTSLADAAYNPGPVDGNAGSDGATSSWPADASAPNLCHLSAASICDPDEPATSEGCRIAPDGGAYDPTAGTGDVPMSCHVPSSSDSSSLPPPSPVCLPAGTGMNDAPCKESSDCAPRYECVADGTSSGARCRRYCCAGNGACSSDQFCDVQPLSTASSTTVPVCMPITPAGGCKLLDDADCGSADAGTRQTCAVVNESGATSCVDTGPAKAGDSCEAVHCGKDLVCLGAPGARQCYTLCHTAAVPSECTNPGETCKGGLPLFPDPNVGICQ